MRLVLLALVLAACSTAPTISPSQCVGICPEGVCWYSDDRAGHGACVCMTRDGDCPIPPTDGGGE